jgi:hypothetical protein
MSNVVTDFWALVPNWMTLSIRPGPHVSPPEPVTVGDGRLTVIRSPRPWPLGRGPDRTSGQQRMARRRGAGTREGGEEEQDVPAFWPLPPKPIKCKLIMAKVRFSIRSALGAG